MSSTENVPVTWERFVEHGRTHYRSRNTAFSWELAFDGDGWCLSREGARLEWYGDPDGAMAWVDEEEARLRGPIRAGCEDEMAAPRTEGDVMPRFLVRLYREVTVWQFQPVEVEAFDEEDAERRAIRVVGDDDFDEEQWEIIDFAGLHSVLVPPHAISIESLPQV